MNNIKLKTDFIQCVPWEQIEQCWGKREYSRFVKWMRGQTTLHAGVYIDDVIRYAEGRNRGEEDPEVED